MLTMPEIAKRVAEIGTDRGIPELVDLAGQMPRRQSAKRAPPTSTPMSDDLRDEIRAYSKEHPALSQAMIAVVFGLNQGRVSEALHGKRS